MQIPVIVDARGASRPLDRFFQRGVGSCHAYLTLREDFRDHVRLAQKEIGFGGIRFHGIFTDHVGVVHHGLDADGGPRLNFQNVTKIYEFFVAQGMKPFVELGFMPSRLASGPQTIFEYKGNITPPKDWAQWTRLVRRFVRHLADHFGLEEIRTWHFEVWNEPDLHNTFWTGSKTDYFRLYEETVLAVKSVDDGLRVGGPATSKTMWVPDLLAYCAERRLPLDFVSTHHYSVDADLVLGEPNGPMYYRGPKGQAAEVARVRSEIAASAFPQAELHFTEWNCSPAHEDVFGKDTSFTAAFALQSIKEVSGLADSYMWWTVSDIFEESGLSLRPFTGKYGLVNIHGVKKPVYHAFRWLAGLHDTELDTTHPSARVTISPARDGLRLLAWNLPEVFKTDLGGGPWETCRERREDVFTVRGLLPGSYRIRTEIVDETRGNALHAWRAMGEPDYLKAEQIAALHAAAEPVVLRDETVDVGDDDYDINLALPPASLARVEFSRV